MLSGVKPLNSTFAETPPIVTVGVARVSASGCDGVASPDGGVLFTAPSPLA